MSLPSPTNISELALSIKKFDEQLSLDRNGDPDVYVPEIYALETSKVWLLNQAVIREERKPGFAFWIDLDAFGNEDHPLVEWPDHKRLKEIWKYNDDESILLSLVGLPHSTVRYWSDSLGTISTKFLSGTILGGPTSIIPDFTSRFYRAHDTLLRMRAFVGSTEAVLSALALSLPRSFATLPMPPDTPLPFENAAPTLPRGCGPRPWTYLLASDSERILLREKEWWKAWFSRKGWLGWKECSIGEDEGASGVISLRDALQGLFGKWDGNKAHWE